MLSIEIAEMKGDLDEIHRKAMEDIPPCPRCKSCLAYLSRVDMCWCRNCNNVYEREDITKIKIK